MRPNARLAALLLAVTAVLACTRPEEDPPPGPPDITTAALDRAYKALPFTMQLTATAGGVLVHNAKPLPP